MIFRVDALKGRHILVTGASSGLGRDAAIMMAGCGARVTLCGRNTERLKSCLDGLPSGDHQIISADFSDFDAACAAVISASENNGILSGVYHAAGVSAIRPATLYNVDHFANVFNASLKGAFGIAKACSKRKVLADGGSILLMSSVAGIRGRAGLGAYSACKAAIGGLTRSLAAEFASRRIRVNEIIAGAVETPMHTSAVKNLDEAGVDVYRSLHLLGFGEPGDISALVTFMMSDAARWITGSSLVVDGGYSAV